VSARDRVHRVCSAFAVMDGIIILSQYNQLIDEGYDRVKAVIRTGELQLAAGADDLPWVAGVGLLAGGACSAGIGSQVQKPLAVVGGDRHDAGAAGHPGDTCRY